MMDELDKAVVNFVKDSYVTQDYGTKNAKYYGKGKHEGTDYHAKKGTAVYGVAGWKVLDSYNDYNLGNVLVIVNPQTGEKIKYAHLDSILAKKGDTISSNDTVVAKSGGSGRTIGGQPQQEHLHVEYVTPDGRTSDVTQASLLATQSKKAGIENPIVPSYQSLIDSFKPKQVQAAEGTPTGKTTQQKTQDYLIKHGDSLSKIAQQYGTTWQELARANPAIKNPNLIYSGNTLKVPSPQTSPSFSSGVVSKPNNNPYPIVNPKSTQPKPYSGNGYLIKSGDSLSKIARDLGTTVGTLMAKNNIEDPNKIYSGKVLKY